MAQYFRITGYHPERDLSVIMDSNGMFEKLWQFSSFLLQKGMKVLEVSSDEKFLDVNITKVAPDADTVSIRAYCKGKPESIKYELNGVVYVALRVGDKIYIPDKNNKA